MPGFGRVTRLLCTWFACAMLSLASVPGSSARHVDATQQLAFESSAEQRDDCADLTVCTEQHQISISSERARAAVDSLALAVVRAPALATEHLVQEPELYQRHCSLLC